MRLTVRNPKGFWSGMMFIGFGVLALIMSRRYTMGTAMDMGPGYFPTLLGGLMLVLGGIIAATALRVQGEGIGPVAWRPLTTLSLAFWAFGWAMQQFGFLVALTALVIFAALAGRSFKIVEVLALVVVLVAGSVALFIYGLGLPFPLFWWD